MNTKKPSKATIENAVIDALTTVYDPEIPVNIYELGLVYAIEVSDELDVFVQMTLTTPNCPVADSLPLEVEAKVNAIEHVGNVRIQLVWDPPWTPDRMTEAAKLELGFL